MLNLHRGQPAALGCTCGEPPSLNLPAHNRRPVEMIGFHLKPFAFFEQNLAVDLPPTRNAASRELITGGAGPGGAGVAGACCAAPSISGPAVAAAPAAGPEPRSKL